MGRPVRLIPLFVFGLFAIGSGVPGAQVISIRPAPQHPAPSNGLSGTWVLKSIDLGSGMPLTDGMKVWLGGTRLILEGENNGKFTFIQRDTFKEAPKPEIQCDVTIVAPYSVAKIEGHTFLRATAGTWTPSPKCSPYPTQPEPTPPQNFMFDLAGDTLTTFTFGGADGVLIYTYVRAKPSLFQFKDLPNH